MSTRGRQFHPLDVATKALRLRSAVVLKEGLVGYLRASKPGRDSRDVMIGLGPLYDCAHRLGTDIVELFNDAASQVGGEVGEIAREFGSRTDITPQTFKYEVTEEPGGPAYRWTW